MVDKIKVTGAATVVCQPRNGLAVVMAYTELTEALTAPTKTSVCDPSPSGAVHAHGVLFNHQYNIDVL
ncbi:hypothetical protein AN958_03093 [Leucoagaricus sp. SymC.cos]|nr:hypothetical protein AN958_03093 [Leucoagaricus sp. SymC.cos]